MHVSPSRHLVRSCALALLCTSVAFGGTTVPKTKSTSKKGRGRTAMVPPKPPAATPPAVRGPNPPDGTPMFLPPVVTETVAHMHERARRIPATVGPPSAFPELKYPDRRHLPGNPDSPATSTMVDGNPDAAAATARASFTAVPLAAQTLGINFTGATLADANAVPPDSMGAIGPTQYLVTINGRLRTFNKTTGADDGVMNLTSDAFFAGVVSGPTFATTDPRVRYDRLSARWFVIMIDFDTRLDSDPAHADPNNRILLAWTDAASNGVISNSTVWSFSSISQLACSASTDCLEDYPTLGVDANALYIGTNTFTNASNYRGTGGYVVPKAPLLAGSGSVTHFTLVATASGIGPFTPQGVDNFDPNATQGYFIGVDNATFGTLMFRRVSNPGTTPTISANIARSVSTTSFPIAVPHLGNTGGNDGQLDALDDRLFAAHIRNGRLWTAHNIQVDATGVASDTGGRDGVRWYELNVPSSGTPTVVQSGTLFDPAASNPRFFWIPSIMVNGQGHAAMGFSTAGTDFAADAGFTGRLLADTLATLDPVATVTSSSTAYNPSFDPGGPEGRRWGDYSYTSLDPLDDMTMWTIQEFCDATDSYGVRIAKLIAPPPATLVAATPPRIEVGLPSVPVTITGSSIGGSGFYDPGLDLTAPALPFAHATASVSGGIAVNSVTVVNPTTVILDLNTTAATDGSRVNVTITNPDGQSASGNAILDIGLVAPVNVAATATSGSSVHISWSPVPGADQYQVYRTPLFTTTPAPVGSPVALTSLDDSTLIDPDTSYLYSVVAIELPSSVSAPSATDIATTTVYTPSTDDPLLANASALNAASMAKTRNAVKAVRAAAGLNDFAYTNAVAADQLVRSIDITETRAALNEALPILGLPLLVPSNSAATGTIVRGADIDEIRNRTK